MTTSRDWAYQILRITVPEHGPVGVLPADVVDGCLEGVEMQCVSRSELNRGWLEGVQIFKDNSNTSPQWFNRISSSGGFMRINSSFGTRRLESRYLSILVVEQIVSGNFMSPRLAMLISTTSLSELGWCMLVKQRYDSSGKAHKVTFPTRGEQNSTKGCEERYTRAANTVPGDPTIEEEYGITCFRE